MVPELTLTSALALGVASLAGAIVVMYKANETRHNERKEAAEKQHSECRADLKALQDKYENLLKLLAPEFFHRKSATRADDLPPA